MGIYDRQYYRDDDDGPGWNRPSAPRMMTTQLVVVTAVIYFADAFFLQSKIGMQCAIHVGLFRDHWKAWQLLSYGFLHADVMHLLWNMYGLFLFGRDVERRYGRQEYLRFYLASIVVSGGAWLMIQSLTGSQAGILVGASGGVTAVLVLYCFNFPQRRLLLMGIWEVPAWGLGVAFVGVDLLGALGGGSGRVAYEAHLAGAAFAFTYFSQRWTFSKWNFLPGKSSFRKKPRLKLHDPEQIDQQDQAADRVLEKIRQSGEASLTRKERRILEEYSRRMREKHQS
tara:strand:- start:77 stop:925 length:849 start_codon:yes stop_codon:yes gene_type:complete